MQCSIVMATKNKASYLQRTFASIFRQQVPFEYEVIVVDDGSTDNTRQVCEAAGVRYTHLENSEYRNPSKARNVGYRMATGEIVIAQSDEVIHHTPDTIKQLCNRLRDEEFLIATVYNYCMRTHQRLSVYTGKVRTRPFFFLGSLWRRDLYAIGGSDEDFTGPGYDDDWFADCLIHGRKLKPRFLDQVIGYHQDHPRPQDLNSKVQSSKRLYAQKKQKGVFTSAGGPWGQSELIKAWWERQHRTNRKNYLAGSSGPSVWEFLHIEDRIRKGTVALEIGVGLGLCTEATHQRGVLLSVLDISEVGLQRVGKWTEARYRLASRLPSDTFDLAFSHLVAQHMSDEDLVAQMRQVLRSLKQRGVFAMQFADSPRTSQDMHTQETGGVCRSPEAMQKLVAKAGGQLTWLSQGKELAHDVKWYAAHIGSHQ